VVNFEDEKLGNLFKAKLTMAFRNCLKIDGLKFDLLEENFPISHFQNPKLTTTGNHPIALVGDQVYLQSFQKIIFLEKSNFVDQIRIFCRSGHGGPGSKHFMRNKFTAMGGPDGGDGGRGGHIILKGNSNLWTLLHLRYFKNILAENGEGGSGNNKTGRFGKDIYIEVPLGTIARDEKNEKQEAEILEDGQEVIWIPGGKGGLGNSHFATPTNQAPEHAQPGLPGIEAWKVLELKVLADVGLVGFPNAGKSTLLSVITAAKPKIADYAFTTITPNLGIVEYRDGRSFCMADLPGIIEGAAEGKGLGHRFLRHIERNSILLFLIPADSDDHRKEFEILVKELEKYNPELLHKQFIIAVSKSDLLDDELKAAIEKELPPEIPHIFISSAANKGIIELKDLLWKVLNEPQE
jgi:GTP-binding protein